MFDIHARMHQTRFIGICNNLERLFGGDLAPEFIFDVIFRSSPKTKASIFETG
jgi:hypothetical protein